MGMTDSKQIDQKISIAFHMYDEDGNNALSKEEVVDMIQVCIM
jgi:Ca2+-binding EF-hand superfamily protein